MGAPPMIGEGLDDATLAHPAIAAFRELLLRPYKDGDANVRSVWLCSRNDAIGNVIVMAAALGVWGTSTGWPDLAVAAVMAGIFLSSSVQNLRQAWAEYREDSVHAYPAPAE